MENKFISSNKKYIILLICVLVSSIILFSLFQERFNISEIGKVVTHPTDKEENLLYERKYHPSSDNLIQRDRIVIKNCETKLMAQDIDSKFIVEAGNIQTKSNKDIISFSEYVGYLYMYDGSNVYRIVINTPTEIRTTIKDCLKFEPMGNYIYSLKEYNGNKRLFRCSLTGSNEELLFHDSVEDFWVSNGNILMKLSDGKYFLYNVISKKSDFKTIPKDIKKISLYNNDIYYIKNTDTSLLYCYSCDSNKESFYPISSVLNYSVSNNKIAFLFKASEGVYQVASCDTNGSNLTFYTKKDFKKESSVEITNDSLYVIEKRGSTWYTPLNSNEWEQLFNDINS